MKAIKIYLSIFLFPLFLSAQKDSIRAKRNVIWFIPSKVKVINGIAIGPVESALMEKTQKVNGVTIIFIGMGTFGMAGIGHDPYEEFFKSKSSQSSLDSMIHAYDTGFVTDTSYVHNGLVVAGGGILTNDIRGVVVTSISGFVQQVKGVSINGLFNWVVKMHGVSIGFFNQSFEVNGVQIGLFNRTVKLRGLQIGLFNRNIKRGLPFINWSR